MIYTVVIKYIWLSLKCVSSRVLLQCQIPKKKNVFNNLEEKYMGGRKSIMLR